MKRSYRMGEQVETLTAGGWVAGRYAGTVSGVYGIRVRVAVGSGHVLEQPAEWVRSAR